MGRLYHAGWSRACLSLAASNRGELGMGAYSARGATKAHPEAAQPWAVALAQTVGGTFAGQMILFTLLNLLVRLELYAAKLEVTLPEVERHSLLRLLDSGPFPRALERFFVPFPAARRLRISTTPVECDAPALRLVVGPQPGADTLSVWADGWVSYLNAEAPFRVEDANSVGA